MESMQTASTKPKATLKDAAHEELSELHDVAALLWAAQSAMLNGDSEARNRALRLVTLARAKVDRTTAVLDELV